MDLPGAHLLLAGGQEGLQSQDVETDAGQLVQTGFLESGVFKHLAGVRLVQLGQFGLELRVEEDRLGRGHRGRQLGFELLVAQLVVVHVEHVDERLGGHQVQLGDVGLVDPAVRGRMIDGLAGLKDLLGLLDGRHVLRADLLAAQVLLQLRQRVLDGLHIRQDQLGVDRVDVVRRVHAAVDVHDVVVLERTHDLADRVGLADVGQELVAQALALGRALDDAGDVHERDGGRHDLLGVHELGEHRQTVVRQRHDAGIRLDGGERIVLRQHVVAGQCVEQCGLAHVRQADDSNGKRHALQPTFSPARPRWR